MDEVFNCIIKEMESRLTDRSVSHNINHHKRVYNNCMWLCDELEADKEIVGAAALTHDLHRDMGDGYVKPSESLEEVQEILKKSGFPEEKIDEVLHCVEFHEEYNFEESNNPEESLEAMILQDADNLDAMGAVGIARTFSFGGEQNNPMWRPENKSEEYEKQNLDEATINHIRTKLLKLKENMNTNPAKRKAQDRHEFIEEFMERFKSEWKAEL